MLELVKYFNKKGVLLMAYPWRLGLNLGTDSIGWSALEIRKNGNLRLIDAGVRSFPDSREPDGTPLNEVRRTARLVRRQRDRKNRRKKMALNFLIKNGLMPQEDKARLIVASYDPYKLRAEALERQLSPFELGRIMMHFAIRRGFKSNRIYDLAAKDEKTDENKGMLEAVENLQKQLENKTLGQWLYEQKKNNNPIRFQPATEKHKNSYSYFPSREMYEQEFQKILDFQKEYFSKKLNWNILHDIIFNQRPLKPQIRGFCQYYTDKPRAYKCFPSYQIFKILQNINGLKYYDKDNVEQEVSCDMKKRLFHELSGKPHLTFKQIRKIFKDKKISTFNLEDEKKDKIFGNQTSSEMQKNEYFGSVWNELPLKRQDEIIELLITEDDPNVIYSKLKIPSLKLSDTQINNISNYIFPKKIIFYSSDFMIDVSNIMYDQWLPLSKAVKLLNLKNIPSFECSRLHTLSYYGKILSNLSRNAKESGEKTGKNNDETTYGRFSNPTLHVAFNQIRKVVNGLIRRFGKPEEIIIEATRNLKVSLAEKNLLIKEQNIQQKNSERIKKELVEKGIISPSKKLIKKYKLWEELSTDPLLRRCPYCGKTIELQELLSDEIEIEHILPYSRTLINSMDNLTVAHKICNQIKKDLSPYEAFGNNQKGFEWNTITEISSNLPYKKRRKFFSNAMNRFHEETGGFIDKQINDTSYISISAKNYLSSICDSNKILINSGKITSLLCGLWELNPLLNKGNSSWALNTEDKRHHALNSIIIGLCNRQIVSELSRYNKSKGYDNLKAPPFPLDKKDVEKVLKNIVVSYKQDHGYEGCILKETAMGKHTYLVEVETKDIDENDITRIVPKHIKNEFIELVKKSGFKKAKQLFQKQHDCVKVYRDKFVTRAPVVSLTLRDIYNIADNNIRNDLINYLEKHPFQNETEYKNQLQDYCELNKIHSVRYFPKDQKPIQISSYNKYYMPNDFFQVNIWRIPVSNSKYVYKGEYITRLEAYKKQKNKQPSKNRHPAAKFIGSLHKNDIIFVSNAFHKEYCKITCFSSTNNCIDIQPLYPESSISAWKEKTNPRLLNSFWNKDCKAQNFKNINTLFQDYSIILMKITACGELVKSRILS